MIKDEEELMEMQDLILSSLDKAKKEEQERKKQNKIKGLNDSSIYERDENNNIHIIHYSKKEEQEKSKDLKNNIKVKCNYIYYELKTTKDGFKYETNVDNKTLCSYLTEEQFDCLEEEGVVERQIEKPYRLANNSYDYGFSKNSYRLYAPTKKFYEDAQIEVIIDVYKRNESGKWKKINL